MAEGVGFEPTGAVKPRTISSRVHSTTLPTLRVVADVLAYSTLNGCGTWQDCVFVPVCRLVRSDGRVAEGTGLLNLHRVKSSIGGSNPPRSANLSSFLLRA